MWVLMGLPALRMIARGIRGEDPVDSWLYALLIIGGSVLATAAVGPLILLIIYSRRSAERVTNPGALVRIFTGESDAERRSRWRREQARRDVDLTQAEKRAGFTS